MNLDKQIEDAQREYAELMIKLKAVEEKISSLVEKRFN